MPLSWKKRTYPLPTFLELLDHGWFHRTGWTPQVPREVLHDAAAPRPVDRGVSGARLDDGAQDEESYHMLEQPGEAARRA